MIQRYKILEGKDIKSKLFVSIAIAQKSNFPKPSSKMSLNAVLLMKSLVSGQVNCCSAPTPQHFTKTSYNSKLGDLHLKCKFVSSTKEYTIIYVYNWKICKNTVYLKELE